MSELQFTVDHDRSLIHVVCTGDIDKEGGVEIISRARESAVEHNYNILYDMRDASVDVKLADWYLLPRNKDLIKNSESHTINVSILAPTDNAESNYKFYETAATNIGLSVRVFTDEAKALDWLTIE